MIFKSQKLLPCLYILTVCIISVICEDIKHSRRQGKILTFDLDDEDVGVALDFSIPFLKIPFKKTLNSLQGFGLHEMSFPEINLNPLAIGLGGVLIAFTTLIAPIITKIYGWHNLNRSSRVSDDNLNWFAYDISEKLISNSGRCPERVSCFVNQKSRKPEVIQMWKEIFSNKLLSSFINATSLEEAALNGIKGHNCLSYNPCPIDGSSIPKIIRSLEILTNKNIY